MLAFLCFFLTIMKRRLIKPFSHVREQRTATIKSMLAAFDKFLPGPIRFMMENNRTSKTNDFQPAFNLVRWKYETKKTQTNNNDHHNKTKRKETKPTNKQITTITTIFCRASLGL